MIQAEKQLKELGDKLADIAENLSSYEDWANDWGYPAVAHKLEETWGSLNSAAAAAYQYAEGTLTRKE